MDDYNVLSNIITSVSPKPLPLKPFAPPTITLLCTHLYVADNAEAIDTPTAQELKLAHVGIHLANGSAKKESLWLNAADNLPHFHIET